MRFLPYVGAVLAVALGSYFLFFSHTAAPHPAAIMASESSDSAPKLLILSGNQNSPITIEDLLPALPRPAASASTSTSPSTSTSSSVLPIVPTKTSAPKKTAVVATTTAPAKVASLPIPIPPLPTSGNVSLDTVAARLRAALVNIVCLSSAGSGIKSISGSGIVVDSRGIILTNAHVAQMFLLADRGVSCTIRTGSPAANSYRAALMFISPAWVRQNAAVITEAAPQGDGQHDYAFLAITGAAPGTSLPASFSSVPLASTAPGSVEDVVLASYGAQFLETSQIESSLFPTVVFGSVKAIYTYAVNTIDVISLGGSIAAQEGSSGGGVADASGNLIGTITTSTVEGNTATRNVNAITAAYVRRAYADETGTAVSTLFADTPANAVKNFAPQIPALEAQITANLK